MKKALKILRKIFFWIFFVSLFLTTVVTVVLYVYEDEIKQYAVDELNEHLNTPVEVEDIELSLFHSFPSASIEFKNVFIADAFETIESDDTLFHAKSMFFNFNIMDIYSGDYKVKRISVHDGGLHMKTTELGETNYDIIKPPEERTNNEDNFAFLLELLEIENFSFKYKNLAAQQFYDLDIHEGLFQGDFHNNEFDLVSDADLHINRLKSNSFTLVKNKEADLNLQLAVNADARSYLFQKGDLMIEEMPFHVTGIVDSSNLDLNVSGNNIELADFANSLVDESLEDVKSYQGEGIIDFESHIHGPISPTEMPAIEAEFKVEGGSVTEPESNLTIRDVHFYGQYQNEQEGRQESLALKDVKANMLESHFEGDALVENFSQPLLTTQMNGDIDLNRFHKFFIFESIDQLGGHVQFDLDAEIQFFDPEFNAKTFDVKKSNGAFHLNKVKYKGAQDEIVFEEISGEMLLNNTDAAAHDLFIRTENSDLLLNGAMKNLTPYLDGSGNLGVIASIESDHIDLNEFIQESSSQPSGKLEVFELPDNLNLNVDLDVKDIKWENHQFTEVTSKMLLSNREVKMNALNLKTLEGEVKGNLHLKNMLENGNIIDGKLAFNGVNINTLFKEWDNFDQKSITHKHLSGRTNGNADILLTFNPYFSLVDDRLFSKCNFNIKNGELKNLETMKSITDYMRSNKALKLLLNKHIDKFEQKLLHLEFSDIHNEITIQDRKVVIPKMTIKSNAMDIDLFGWHDFDNNVEYHFSFRFRELKERVVENEFGIIEDDGTGLVVYITMTGNIDDPEFSTDGEQRRVEFKEKMKEEKQNIKSMLKTELGFFKKDTTVQRIKKDNKQEVKFILYDEEQDDIKEDSVIIEEKKNKKQSIKWYQKWKKEADQKKQKIEYEEEK